MAIYSKLTQYAVSMLSRIALADEEQLTSVRDVAAATGISEPTVAKTLQLLVKGGLLESRKGPGGGFHLTLTPRSITLGKIVRVVEGKEPFSECVAGLESCSEESVCPVHEKWKIVKGHLDDFLDSTTLEDMALVIKRFGP